MSEDVERYEEHPTPDRFFQKIGTAEFEMRPMDHDDVTFKSQLVPGGTFAVELTAKYSYAGRDCSQHLSLNRAAAEDLHERLGDILEADDRRDRGGYEGFYVRGEPANVDAVVTVDGERYVLARTGTEAVPVKHRTLPDEVTEKIAREEDVGVYHIDE